MARTVAVQYVGPFAEVDVPALGTSVARGVPVRVSAELAGSAPDGDDLGSGLLAQPSNWLPVAAGEEG